MIVTIVRVDASRSESWEPLRNHPHPPTPLRVAGPSLSHREREGAPKARQGEGEPKLSRPVAVLVLVPRAARARRVAADFHAGERILGAAGPGGGHCGGDDLAPRQRG